LQLNGSAGAKNQLLALSAEGCFSGNVGDVSKLPALADATDTKATLDWRVRSYLAVNCVMCHQPGGAQGSWDARPTSANAALVGAKPIDPKGDDSRLLIAPGDPAHSMLLLRLAGNGVPRMPPVATNVVDERAIKMLTEGIEEVGKRADK